MMFDNLTQFAEVSTHMANEVSKHILVVDDDEFTVMLVSALLKKQGFRLTICRDGAEAIAFLRNDAPDLVLLDLIMPEISGFQTLSWIKSTPELEELPVICVTTLDDSKTLNRIFESGAADYVGKPVRENELLARIRLHLSLRSKEKELNEATEEMKKLRERLLDRQLRKPDAFAPIITRSPKMLGIFHYLEAIAASTRTCLITGETGVGKELIARSVHDASGREGKFVVVNVAGLDDNLFSDTLFGHEKGAFTGAIRSRTGLVSDAAGGTLFLDEIGDLSMASQVKLLRLLQEREYFPLGSDERHVTDARVVVATHANLEEKVQEGEFRSDLFYRLHTHHVQIPPLRKRPEDIPLLFSHFCLAAAEDIGIDVPDVPDDLIRRLIAYRFPGNVRELEALAHDLVSRSQLEPIRADAFLGSQIPEVAPEHIPSLPDHAIAFSGDDTLPTIKEMTEILIDQALERTDGNRAAAARILGISRQALHKRLKSRDDEDDNTDEDDD